MVEEGARVAARQRQVGGVVDLDVEVAGPEDVARAGGEQQRGEGERGRGAGGVEPAQAGAHPPVIGARGARRLSRPRGQARDMYAPERVSTLTRSPMFTNSGTLHGGAGLQRGRLGAAARRRVAADARLRVRDLELHRGGELQVGRLVVDEEQVDRLARLDPLERLLHRGLRDGELLVATTRP